jgi:hypothetical protein
LTLKGKKYPVAPFLLSLVVIVAVVVSCSPVGRMAGGRREAPVRRGAVDSVVAPIFDRDSTAAVVVGAGVSDSVTVDTVSEVRPVVDSAFVAVAADTLVAETLPVVDSALIDSALVDSVGLAEWRATDSVGVVDSLAADTVAVSRTPRERDEPFLEAPVFGTVEDSLVYDARRRLIFRYGTGEIKYEDVDLKADHVILNADTKEIFGVGRPDTAGVMSRPEFVQGGSNYTMDTLRYNLGSRKAKIQGVATKDGEGYLLGRDLKKMPDNTINIAHAKYTTCDNVEHPHFYIAMTKAKVIPGKKIITGPAYFVMEDVPIYFLGLPGGFFPIATGPQSGFLMPQYGEEANRGFYLRGGGYYFTFGDYADLRLTGDIYTLGSWGLNGQTSYVKRYKYRGSLGATYNRMVMDRGGVNEQNSGSFSVNWTHSQDPKANPRQTFSASVNFSTAGQKKLATTSLADHMNTNTTSSISYARNWAVGTTNINMTAAFNLATNSVDSSMSVTLPNVSLSVSSFAPFKRKVQVGSERWYEKITMSYQMQAQNSTGRMHEDRVFTKETLQEMQNGVRHSIPVKTSFNILGYINFAPSFNYSEVWNFKRERRVWDPTLGTNGTGGVRTLPAEFGFFRTYGWDLSGSFSTKVYGTFEVKRRAGKTGWLQAFRHVLTPTVGFTYAPDFTHPRYGFTDYVQSSESGTYTSYNPILGSPTMSPGAPRASVNFSLSNQLELKVRSGGDSTGVKKIPLIEQFSLSGSYNFLAPGDSLQLSTIGLQLRTGQIFKNFAIQLNATWDPYQYVDVGGQARRIGKLAIGGGKFGRILNTGWTFGYTFNSSTSGGPAINDITSGAYVNPYDRSLDMDPALRRQRMVASYYDFSIPWNFGFNYSVNYSHTALKPQITQTLGFNGSVTLTEKWGVTFNGGFDIARRRFTPMQMNLSRDLHCWEMSFQWVPIGYMKSYSFHIGIRSGMLADIKYDKSSNMYDNMLR